MWKIILSFCLIACVQPSLQWQSHSSISPKTSPSPPTTYEQHLLSSRSTKHQQSESKISKGIGTLYNHDAKALSTSSADSLLKLHNDKQRPNIASSSISTPCKSSEQPTTYSVLSQPHVIIYTASSIVSISSSKQSTSYSVKPLPTSHLSWTSPPLLSSSKSSGFSSDYSQVSPSDIPSSTCTAVISTVTVYRTTFYTHTSPALTVTTSGLCSTRTISVTDYLTSTAISITTRTTTLPPAIVCQAGTTYVTNFNYGNFTTTIGSCSTESTSRFTSCPSFCPPPSSCTRFTTSVISTATASCLPNTSIIRTTVIEGSASQVVLTSTISPTTCPPPLPPIIVTITTSSNCASQLSCFPTTVVEPSISTTYIATLTSCTATSSTCPSCSPTTITGPSISTSYISTLTSCTATSYSLPSCSPNVTVFVTTTDSSTDLTSFSSPSINTNTCTLCPSSSGSDTISNPSSTSLSTSLSTTRSTSLSTTGSPTSGSPASNSTIPVCPAFCSDTNTTPPRREQQRNYFILFIVFLCLFLLFLILFLIALWRWLRLRRIHGGVGGGPGGGTVGGGGGGGGGYGGETAPPAGGNYGAPPPPVSEGGGGYGTAR